ncbi:uncharacterized protein LY79DRAFT_43071 [Colletotrichum navitas]|uniref:Uncharacterized protein n=1 Tax=Colletotrichum navitas TaxID=681940 RepID=A0AAD8UZ60_9PEZI|nr:uncharacterized protein LY79DRAFT_43071 [Colletotrichum navitas]KAK1572759.1 hypothetical protein LY79DRAFT_43071 [Colletotrichum navitas]
MTRHRGGSWTDNDTYTRPVDAERSPRGQVLKKHGGLHERTAVSIYSVPCYLTDAQPAVTLSMAESKSSRGQQEKWGEGIEASAPTPRRRSKGPVPGKDLAQRGDGDSGRHEGPALLKVDGDGPFNGRSRRVSSNTPPYSLSLRVCVYPSL